MNACPWSPRAWVGRPKESESPSVRGRAVNLTPCEVNVTDASCALNWLFSGAATPGCLAAVNTNGDDEANITDAVYVLQYLFGGGPAPVDPYPDCGPGLLPADVELGCANPPNCQ